MTDELLMALLTRIEKAESRLALLERMPRLSGVTTSHTHSSMAASDGDPDPALAIDDLSNVLLAGAVRMSSGYYTSLDSTHPLDTGVTVGADQIYLLAFLQGGVNLNEYNYLYLVSRQGTANLVTLIGGGGGWFSAGISSSQIRITSSSATNRYCRWTVLRLY